VPLSSIDITDRERRYVREAIDSGWISSRGRYVREFEAAIAGRVGRSFVAATASGTCALELVLRALEIGPGDEVIVPALSFGAPASAVAAVGARPVFADVTAESWTIDPEEVRRVRTSRTRLLIAVDVLGHPCDFEALEALGIPILEDAAQAHGSSCRGRPAGSLGVASIFSFHANKTISAGEGGCVATDDRPLIERILELNDYGIRPDQPYTTQVVGHNYRMSNLSAAVGLAQAERWDELVAGRNAVSEAYDRTLADTSLQRRPVVAWAEEATWLHTVATEERAAVLASCARAGVDARAIWPALPDHPAFEASPIGSWDVARDVSARALWLPTWSGMPAEAIALVSDAVQRGLKLPPAC
jgi:perosamine synthetase